MFKQVSTKALYAKLQTFLPSIVTWDVPFTPQEEQARVQFVTQGEGFETLQSVVKKQTIRWEDELALMAVAELPITPAAVTAAPTAVTAVTAAPTAVTAAPATPVLTAVEPKTDVPTLELCAVGTALDDDFQVVKSKVKALALTVEPNPAGIRTVVARNLPRDIKDTEIRTLFGAHAIAGLRDVYIPRNTDKSSPHFGTLKGFALVKFHTVAESTRAFEALKTLTIRGKNIALEFAKEDR
jgi:hypothetical protein